MMTEQGFTESIRNLRNRRYRMEREGDYWTRDEKERLITMFHEGVGLSEIAIRLQRTEPAVCQQIEKLDLYERKQNPRRRRGMTKPRHCLCFDCNADAALCPLYAASEEGC